MSDSKKIIALLAEQDKDNGQEMMVMNILEECKKMMKRRWTIRFHHIFREHNRLADAMAKKTIYQLEALVFLIDLWNPSSLSLLMT